MGRRRIFGKEVRETGDAMQPSDGSAESETLVILHQELASGKSSTADDLAGRLLFRLISPLLRQYSAADPDVIWDSVTETILNYLRDPGMFDPSHGTPLDVFLSHCARRNITDKLRSEARRRKRETNFYCLFENNFVELGDSAANIEMETEIDFARDLGTALKSPLDRKIFELCVNGERSTEVFADVLGVSELPIEEQRRAVKRAKDRILKMVRRKSKRRR